MILSTHFSTIDSNTFASIGVSAIGLMSFSIDSDGRFLGNGITVAVFHNFGNTPSRIEILNIDVQNLSQSTGEFHPAQWLCLF